SHQFIMSFQVSQVTSIADAAGRQDSSPVTCTEQLPEHVIVRGLSGAGGEKHYRIVRLYAFERKVAGDLLSKLQPVTVLEQEQTRSQSRRSVSVGLAHQDNIKLQPAGGDPLPKLISVRQHGATDGIGPLDKLGFVPRLDDFVLTAGVTRLPVAQPNRRVLARLVLRQGKVGMDADP